MKKYDRENKRIKTELDKIAYESQQICRILDKDDINIDYLGKLNKKLYFKTPNKGRRFCLPNIIYHQGNLPLKNNQTYNNILASKKKLIKQKNRNDFHTNYFKILKGKDNKKVLNAMIISENFGRGPKKNKNNKKEIEEKLNEMAPNIMQKKKMLTERIPIYIKKYNKDFEYINNQIILDDMNEIRYNKYDDPFKYSLSTKILPKYNSLFFKYQKSKIRDYFYRHTSNNFNKKINTENNQFTIKTKIDEKV